MYASYILAKHKHLSASHVPLSTWCTLFINFLLPYDPLHYFVWSIPKQCLYLIIKLVNKKDEECVQLSHWILDLYQQDCPSGAKNLLP